MIRGAWGLLCLGKPKARKQPADCFGVQTQVGSLQSDAPHSGWGGGCPQREGAWGGVGVAVLMGPVP